MYISSNRRNPKFFDLWKLNTGPGNLHCYTRTILTLQRHLSAKAKDISHLLKALLPIKMTLLYNRTNKILKRITTIMKPTGMPQRWKRMTAFFIILQTMEASLLTLSNTTSIQVKQINFMKPNGM